MLSSKLGEIPETIIEMGEIWITVAKNESLKIKL